MFVLWMICFYTSKYALLLEWKESSHLKYALVYERNVYFTRLSKMFYYFIFAPHGLEFTRLSEICLYNSKYKFIHWSSLPVCQRCIFHFKCNVSVNIYKIWLALLINLMAHTSFCLPETWSIGLFWVRQELFCVGTGIKSLFCDWGGGGSLEVGRESMLLMINESRINGVFCV